MVTNNMQWAAACTHTFGGSAVSNGTGMPSFALAGIVVRKPAAVDARYEAQGDQSAWSPPV